MSQKAAAMFSHQELGRVLGSCRLETLSAAKICTTGFDFGVFDIRSYFVSQVGLTFGADSSDLAC